MAAVVAVIRLGRVRVTSLIEPLMKGERWGEMWGEMAGEVGGKRWRKVGERWEKGGRKVGDDEVQWCNGAMVQWC